jgi:hypothetical protein
MARGKPTRALRPDQIARLEAFKKAAHQEEGAPHGYSYPQLRLAMAAGFRWETLKKALEGRPVWVLHHAYIVEWIERYLPASAAAPDGKAAAAGEKHEETTEAAGTDGTVPGKA